MKDLYQKLMKAPNHFALLAAAAKDERGRLLGTALAPTVAKQMAETFLRTAK